MPIPLMNPSEPKINGPIHNIKGKENIYSISPPPGRHRPRQRRTSDKGEVSDFPPRARAGG